MRIGLFTDTYHPSTNGVVFVVDFTRECLEKLGHEVFIYCPDEKLIKAPGHKKKIDKNIIRLPSLPTVGPDAPRTALFVRSRLMKKIDEHNLDASVFFTPMTVGVMALFAAKKNGTIVIAQHSSDLHRTMDFYPTQIKPVLAFAPLIISMSTKMNRKKVKALAKIYMPDRSTSDKWSKRALDTQLAVTYSSCDAVIAVSHKSERQIKSFTKGTGTDIRVIPTGVDPLPKPTVRKITKLRQKFGIKPDDEVMIYFGRIGEEKDLKFLFPVLERVVRRRPKAKLLLCGDNEYRAELMEIAAKSPVADRIIFAGRYKRNDIPAFCAMSKVYVFPSTFDTQGLTLHEAASSGLPIVLIDGPVTEVVKFGYNGFIVRKSYNDFAGRVIQILSDQKLAEKFSENSKKIASEFTQLGQTEKMVDLIDEKLKARDKV